MAMLLVRGEAPLEPLIFIKQYAAHDAADDRLRLRAGDPLRVDSVALRPLRRRRSTSFSVHVARRSSAASMARGGWTGRRYFDFSGFGFMFEQTPPKLSHDVDLDRLVAVRRRQAAGPLPRALSLGGGCLGARASSRRSIAASAAAAGARSSSTASIRRGSAPRREGKARLDAQLQRAGQAVRASLAAIPVRGAALKDAMMTFAATPFTGFALIGITIAALASPDSLPIAFAIVAIFIADVASRDRRAGTTALSPRAPRLREHFVAWKADVVVDRGAVLLIAPTLRTPRSSLLIGILFIAAAATSLGVISGNPKTFIVLFLTFWYVVVNDKGATPALDFAGFFGNAGDGRDGDVRGDRDRAAGDGGGGSSDAPVA